MKLVLSLISLLLFSLILSQELPKFERDFIWGVATAAYQIEGAANEDGRLPSIWDTFSKKTNKTKNGDTGDIATNHYHKYKEDIKLMADMGVKAYRFSISWSRIMPTGRPPVNEKGIQFYKNLLDELKKYNIEPFVTLYHWDLPQALQDQGGWLNSSIIEAFKTYALTCFENFPSVQYWITFNEPWVFTVHGHDTGTHAPGRCSDRSRCEEGDSNTEQYIAAHNVILAHAQAYRAYHEKEYSGRVGITLNIDWGYPFDEENYKDRIAAERYVQFFLGWFADPIFFSGDYPFVMRERVGERLPEFTQEEKKFIQYSADFFGVNHYTSRYIEHSDNPDATQGWYRDVGVNIHLRNKNGNLIGKPAPAPEWLYIVPDGIYRVLNYIYDRYSDYDIYITEAGLGEYDNQTLSMEEKCNDTHRIEFYKDYIENVYNATQEEIPVKGFFMWSLLDNFEWTDGYSVRFGLYHIDYKDDQKRYAKESALWFQRELEYYRPTILEKYGVMIASIALGVVVVAVLAIIIIVAVVKNLKKKLKARKQIPYDDTGYDDTTPLQGE